MTTSQHRIIDSGGDSLGVFGGPVGLFVAVSTPNATGTAGPFTRAQLDELLDAVAQVGRSTGPHLRHTAQTYGSYTRTTPDPDDMTIGVDAVRLETGAEQPGPCSRSSCWKEDGHDGPCAPSGRPHPDTEMAEKDRYQEAWQAAERAVLDERAIRKDAEDERDLIDAVARDHAATVARLREALDLPEDADAGMMVETIKEVRGVLAGALDDHDETLRNIAAGKYATEPRPLSPREHLAALWETAHRPVNGRIPKGSAIITREDWGGGNVRYGTLEATGRDLPDPGETLDDPRFGPTNGQETRLLDTPEPPQRPEWADLGEALDRLWPHGTDGITREDIARRLHTEAGVRVVTEHGAA